MLAIFQSLLDRVEHAISEAQNENVDIGIRFVDLTAMLNAFRNELRVVIQEVETKDQISEEDQRELNYAGRVYDRLMATTGGIEWHTLGPAINVARNINRLDHTLATNIIQQLRFLTRLDETMEVVVNFVAEEIQMDETATPNSPSAEDTSMITATIGFGG